MQAISGVSRSTGIRPTPARPETAAAAAAPQALVPVLSVAPSEFTRITRYHPVANFLAHLIAVRQRIPQTRRRARAAPDQGAAVYTAARTAPVPIGQILRKSA